MYLSEGFKKIFAQLRSKAGQSGQAVLEYILVLVITVSIILGIMHQFSDAFGGFLDKYFGDYIACLLETGELPALGGSGASEALCQSPMQDFDISAGKALVQSGNNGSGSSGDGGGSGNDTSSSGSDSGGSDSDSSGSNNRNLRPNRVGNGAGSSNADGLSANAQKGRPGQFKQKLNSGGPGQNKNKNVGFGESGGQIGGPGGKTFRSKRIIILGESYLSDDEKKKKKMASSSETKEKKGSNSDVLRTPVQKLEIKKSRHITSEDNSKGFNFGFFIKFLLIAGIIIAIVIFLGGQGLQIKKSWQKSE